VLPGTALGVTGPSGCGKSTLLDILAGLRTPDAGRVEIGGVDLGAVSRASWFGRVAWVPQRPVLLAGTVATNIALARPTAGPEVLHRATALAGLDLPLDTGVGEDGAGLSTGERRRVALARAIVADRPLLLLDEPTEGVDAATEAAILASLPTVAAGRTVVLVSHRPDTLARCDRVVELAALAVPGPVPGPAATVDRAPGDRDVVGSPSSGSSAGPVRREREPGGPLRALGPLGWALARARPQGRRLLAAALLGAGAVGSGVALTATSAWLISAAALRPPLLTLMVAIVAVRAFGLGKGVLRYAERLVSHDAALRVGSALRVRLWGDLVRTGRPRRPGSGGASC
jgi:ATP-binding cassette subfamily C protein CydCD